MNYYLLSLLVICAYLLGSIATAVWVGKAFYNIDVREHGSKNAGATNTIRVLGPKAGIPVFIIDALKGFVAVMLVHFSGLPKDTNTWVNFQLILGVAAVLGHIFPLFAGFKGGKGVATLFGLTLALHPLATLSCFVIFFIVVLIFRYISLGSMVGGVCYPFLIIFVYKSPHTSLIVFSIVVAVLLLLTHKKNIGRLLKGEESKFAFKKKETL